MESFTENAINAFSFLCSKYGFSEPLIDVIGHETFILYHRNNETISISIEPGGGPIIEIFLLCHGTAEPPVPWAEYNGNERYRKFLNLPDIKNFFKEAPSALEATEQSWLNT